MTDPIRGALQQTRDALAELLSVYDSFYQQQWKERVENASRSALAAADAALAAAPQPVALTDEQIIDIRDEHLPSQGESFDCIAFARAIERAHGIAADPTAPGPR